MTAAWFVSFAVQTIPVAERARFRQVLDAELLKVGQGRRRFGYVVRLLARSVPLRWELRRPEQELAWVSALVDERLRVRIYASRAVYLLALRRSERRARRLVARLRLRRAQRLANRSGLAHDMLQLFRGRASYGDLADVGAWRWAQREFLAGVIDPGVGRSAWLVLWAVRVVPAAERLRYREEFEAEMLEIAGGWRRFGHGVRVLGRAVPLRWELRRPARGRVR